jgi:nitrate/TMAO reductase-like tetraheme cytochrome c subunit
MARLSRFFTRYSKPLKISIQLGILAVVLIAIGTVGFIEYSAQPSFCLNCHIMKPYYDSWATSSHNDVKCIACHYAPGIKAEAMGKLQAANQVVKYITGAYGTKPWAEIEDAACLRSGCHTEREIEGAVSFAGIRFDHAHHLGELRRGKDLRCTSCHSQIVQGDHVNVTRSTCFLCHFKDRPPGEPIAGCTGCHASPPVVRSSAGYVVDHPQYMRDLVSCVSCHDKVTQGSGNADQARCYTCHNEPERVAEFENTTLVHRVHIAVHNVECAQCHLPVEHRVVSLTQTFELDCNACHQRVHEEQRQMYAGRGGHGAENMPASMFLARVSCQSCHGIPSDIPGHAEVKRAGEATCMSCHGIKYANILPNWQRELQRRTERVSAVVRNAREALSGVPVSRRVAADSLLGLAEENIGFVERGKGAHNVGYADELLRAAVNFARQAVEAADLTYRIPDLDLGPAVGQNACLQCHFGISEQAAPFADRQFKHEPHVAAGLECTTCHTPMEEHGGIILTSGASCDACHHRRIEPLNCARCHEGPGGAPSQPFETAVGTFSHAPHREAGLACSICHEPTAMSAAGLNCDACHDRHHQPQVTCLNCHKRREGGVIGIHPAVAHEGCAPCHGDKVAGITEWTRQVCTVCHTDKVEHNAPVNCVLCHEMPALRGESN